MALNNVNVSNKEDSNIFHKLIVLLMDKESSGIILVGNFNTVFNTI